MLVHPNPKNVFKSDVRDLQAIPALRFQHRYYGIQVLLTSFVLPAVVAGSLWGDWWGGFFYAGVARLVLNHHSTFCVNSVVGSLVLLTLC